MPSTRKLQPLSSVTSECTPTVHWQRFWGNGFWRKHLCLVIDWTLCCQLMRLSSKQFLDWIFWKMVFRFLKHNGVQICKDKIVLQSYTLLQTSRQKNMVSLHTDISRFTIAEEYVSSETFWSVSGMESIELKIQYMWITQNHF